MNIELELKKLIKNVLNDLDLEEDFDLLDDDFFVFFFFFLLPVGTVAVIPVEALEPV